MFVAMLAGYFAEFRLGRGVVSMLAKPALRDFVWILNGQDVSLQSRPIAQLSGRKIHG